MLLLTWYGATPVSTGCRAISADASMRRPSGDDMSDAVDRTPEDRRWQAVEATASTGFLNVLACRALSFGSLDVSQRHLCVWVGLSCGVVVWVMSFL